MLTYTLSECQGGLIVHLPCIPGFLLRRGMQHFHRDTRTKRVIKDKLCFFRCLSFYFFNDTSHCEELLQLFFPGQTQRTYQGIALNDLNRIEAKYDITIRVYLLIPKKDNSNSSTFKQLKKEVLCSVKCVRGNLMEVEDGIKVMRLNLYNHHFSLVTDTQFHMCTKCWRLFQSE